MQRRRQPRPQPAPATLAGARASCAARNWLPSLIWLIPIVAALVGITLVARSCCERGPEIVLTFKTAEGLEAGKTAVQVQGRADRHGADAFASRTTDRMCGCWCSSTRTPKASPPKTRAIWVVRPRLDTSGMSGLGTLLSGAYIGADAGRPGERAATSSTGWNRRRSSRATPPGAQYLLRARDIGSLDVGSPVYFRRIKVGQVAAYRARRRRPRRDAAGVRQRARTTSSSASTRASGTPAASTSTSSASGLRLRTQSLATILLGGIAFQAPDNEAGPAAEENATFLLADDEGAAMKPPDGPSQTLLMYFNQSLRGLSPGAPVDFRGVVIGEVKSIGVQFDRRHRRVPHAGAGAGLPGAAAPSRPGCSVPDSRYTRAGAAAPAGRARACAPSCAPATC